MDEIEYDTSTVDVFKDVATASFKLNYYHTEGYSSGNRYWYEVIVIDSMIMLNFKSPLNDDWDYVYYQKQLLISDSVLSNVKRLIKSLGITQKRKGVPLPQGTGYGANRLYIETADLQVAGGDVYIAIGGPDTQTQEQFLAGIDKERQQSTSIGGDYRRLFFELEQLFPMLPSLLKDMEKN